MNLKNIFYRYTTPARINPYLVAYTQLMFLYTFNISNINFYSPVRIMVMIFIVISLLKLVVNIFIKEKGKSSLILTLALFISFFAGHLTRVLPYFELGRIRSIIFSRNPILFLLTNCLIILLSLIILRFKIHLRNVNRMIALTFMLILALNLTMIISYKIKVSGQKNIAPLSKRILSSNLPALPDIYYIILDGHARFDVLQHLYNSGNNDLEIFLEKQGFYIASKSQTNHIYTHLSLATSLNYDYIENLTQDFKIGQKNAQLLSGLIENNKAARRLISLGYTYVLFNSGFQPTEKNPLKAVYHEYVYGLNNLELAFLRTNIFSRLLTYINLDPRNFHRNRILYEFETLKLIPEDPRPTFTFAHILAPHPPFVFSETGEEYGKGSRFTLADGYSSVRTKEEYKEGYLGQLIYIDKLLISALSEIIEKSEIPPIIIVQSDHGPASEINWENQKDNIFLSEVIDRTNPESLFERTSILNAYYFPFSKSTQFYESISPVNSFRILFNDYFDGDFPLLPDQTFTDK